MDLGRKCCIEMFDSGQSCGICVWYEVPDNDCGIRASLEKLIYQCSKTGGRDGQIIIVHNVIQSSLE